MMPILGYRCLVEDGQCLAEPWEAHGATWWMRTCLSYLMGNARDAVRTAGVGSG